MTKRTFFPDNVWLDEIVKFEEFDRDNKPVTTQWQIEKKLEEEHHLGGKEDWEDFKGKKPMVAIARFNCVNISDPNDYAFMKVYMQYVASFLSIFVYCMLTPEY
jgi:hypothetical protein